MFGDIGHGLILFSFGLYMVFWNKAIANPIIRMLLPHRYMLALMGFFATYCGFVYNDYLSNALNLFGSCYEVEGVAPGDPIPREEGCVYPFGLDPVWGIADNNLNFVNSLKMKISVIIAVVHMTLGVFVKAANALYFRRFIEFFFEFIPQLAFMILLFGYMDFLIIYKWNQFWPDPSTAPSIITTMINMPLKMGKTVLFLPYRTIAAEDNPCGEPTEIPHKMLSKSGS
jgi:V-type H+-transporting ATPase subunit a